MKLKNRKINWAFLVTGRGRNAADTIEAYSNGALKKSTIKLLVYENTPCMAKDIALKNNIENVQEYQDHLVNELKKRHIDFIFLLGYKHIIKQNMLAAFPNRILNIHPSLFPSFLATQTAIQDAINYGVKITGITTHIIDSEIDKGTILCQKAIKVKDNDTFDTLYPRFTKKGKKLIIKTIKQIEEKHFYE